MTAMRLAEIRLDRFKSFHDAILPIRPLTILTGRNSSGKSNALDAIAVLASLATSESLGEALEGTAGWRVPVRGGARGCAPYGEDSFKLGCVIADDANDTRLKYEVEITVAPILSVRSESLTEYPQHAPKASGNRTTEWFSVVRVQGGTIEVSYRNGGRGRNPHAFLRDDRTALGQLKTEIIAKTKTVQELIRRTEAVAGVLAEAFHVDPVPQQMRRYVPKRAEPLRRNGDNLSSVLYDYRRTDPEGFSEVENLIKNVAGCPVESLDFSMTDNDEVMIALSQGGGRRTTASLMSDGLLRFMTVVTALKTAADSSNRRMSTEGETAFARLVTIEEIENGLHPSHAKRLLDLVERTAEDPDVSVLLTTHSPALLDALRGENLRSVFVCHDDTITPLIDMTDYAAEMSRGTLGRVVTQGKLVSDERQNDADFSEFFDLLGAGA